MAPPPCRPQPILPDANVLVLESVERTENRVVIFARVSQHPHCPVCRMPSGSCHSRYRRRLQDLPWQGWSVQLWLTLRRLRCRNPDCPRKIFCEQIPRIAPRYARQTIRLSEVVRAIGYATGGLPGKRLLERLAVFVGKDVVLRHVKQEAVAEQVPIRNLGVDDWAWRKGQNYGTILVDLDRHCVADLLPDRSAESLAAWLRERPTIRTIARDRGGLYADGGQAGAPDAQQVADRFHLVLNLSGAIERVLEEHRGDLTLFPSESAAASEVRPPLRDSKPTIHQLHQQQVRQSRMERYQRVVELYQEGYSQAAISRETGMGRKTIRRWLRSGQFPERKTPCRQPSKVLDYEEYLRRRWDEGCHNATRLFQEIRQQGYSGGRRMVAIVVSRWRFKGKQPRTPQRISPRHVAILITRAPDKLTPENHSLLDRLVGTCPELMPLRKLALGFHVALASKDGAAMVRWIKMARHSPFGPLVRFAYGLRKDLSAVTAAVETHWSSGQVEGQINRLKTIKRQMYGRCGLNLLRARVLPYTAALAFQPVAHAP